MQGGRAVNLHAEPVDRRAELRLGGVQSGLRRLGLRLEPLLQEVVRREIFARGVKEGGLKFLTYSPRDREDEPSPERRKQLRAIIDLLSMAKARLFLHM